jgi:glycosyltransferase involved in cell wall biosynthesis
MLKETLPELSGKIVTVYNATDLRTFSPAAQNKAPGLASRLRIVVASSYQQKKNMLGVAKALDMLRMGSPGSDVVVDWYGGPGPTPAPLDAAKDFAVRRQLGDRLRFHGPIREIEKEYAAADAVGLLSFYEGLPNSICEGLACGKPVILSDVCDAGSLVTEGENGFTCDPRSPESIATAFQRFAALSPESRRRMGEASRRKAEILFAQDTILDRYEQILVAAAARRPLPTGCAWPQAVPDSAHRTIARWSGGLPRPEDRSAQHACGKESAGGTCRS